MIKACCRVPDKDPDMKMAEGWFHSIADLNPELKPDSLSYANLIFGCQIRKDVQHASHWYSEMLAQDLRPTAETCACALEAAASAPREDWEFASEFAESVFKSMQEVRLVCDQRCREALSRAVGHRRARELA